MSIEKNLNTIKQNIAAACFKSGRKPGDVTVLAVTKNRSADEINTAISLGITDIGENRVQELMEKYDGVKKGVRWHIIGHLQTNKVKYIADKVSMIHSVDSLKLALEINKHCQKLNKIMDILIEVNSGEENKNGVSYSEVMNLVEEVSRLSNVRIRGLMTMAPLGAGEQKLREVFSSLYKLSVDIGAKKYDNVSMEHLSMGMSGDYMIAVEEGATIVRPGRSLFDPAK